MWNWQQPDWPLFTYDTQELADLEAQFLHESGVSHGIFQHLDKDEQQTLTIDFISNEGLKTSEIEGEYLDHASVQSSIRQHFGLVSDNRRISAAERGIAALMVDLYQTFAAPLTHAMLHNWHRMIVGNRADLENIGCYRTHTAPMQIISAYGDVHFEAPPSAQVTAEMARFVEWFNQSENTLSALGRSGIAHLYFVSIHPFEDGNGRIGRAIAQKALAQSVGYPTLLALSHTIEQNKQAYYGALGRANQQNELSAWLGYFGETVRAAQHYSQNQVEFILAKTKLLDRLRDQLNPRQEKALLRIFREGLEGFSGGLSAKNYQAIAKTSKATTTRDLNDLVAKGALFKEGELKSSRYYLNISQ